MTCEGRKSILVIFKQQFEDEGAWQDQMGAVQLFIIQERESQTKLTSVTWSRGRTGWSWPRLPW